ncbi:right-handed parallel beta-helix repeat-containing protein [Candidatus Halobeggiatoa sp. HSG11]|nr:right-handed parallel beta-helix repeat-containing protein [Candidatus Halobeggiatoa sp. HSG11]
MLRTILTLLFLLPLIAHSTTYYISGLTGNDANDGTSEATAWQTIDKLKATKLENDTTILFKRGETFRGTVSILKSPTGTRYDAYGTGANPVIAGSVQITNWQPATNIGPNVYVADVSEFITKDKKGNENTIEHLFVNGELMTIARYPNVDSPAQKNWLKVGATAGNNSFTDPQLVTYNKPKNYWKDATLRIRTYSWYYKVFPITGYSNGKITAKGLGKQLPKWGYFLDDKLEELDHPGEWYYDAKTKKVYLYPKQGNPNNLLVEGSTYKVGLSVYWHEDNSSVQNFTFKHFILAGVEVNSSNNVVVQNCKFEYNFKGITTWNNADLLVTNNVFDNQLNTAIGLNADKKFDVKNSLIEKNHITNTGMFPLYCERYEGVCYGIGIAVFGKAFTVRQNILENVGWNGINLKSAGNHVIENNVVRKALALINDGGAINIGSDGNIIRGNFLLETIGNVDESNGCGSTNKTPCMHHHSYGMGIGADSNFKNNVIEGNTIANNQHQGIRLNSFINTTVRNNIVYNNKNQLLIEGKKNASKNNTVEGNLFYAIEPDQIGLKVNNEGNNGSFNNNMYCNPYNKVVLVKNKKYYSLAHWQQEFSSQDQNSVQCNINLPEYNVTYVGANLLANPDFAVDISNWKGPISHDNGSLKMEFKKGANNANVIPNTFKLTENQWYRLKFTVLGNGFGTIKLRFNDTKPDTTWQILQERFFAYSQESKQYEMFFKSSVTTEYGKILFSTQEYDANYWLDDVSLEPVNMTLNDAKKQSLLLINPTEIPQNTSLQGVVYQDLFGKNITDSVTLAPFSSQILVATGEIPLSIPTAPKLSLNKIGKTVTAAWDAVAGATGYILYYAPYPYTGPASINYIDMEQQTDFSVELPSGATFYVGVTAYNEMGESEYSNVEYFVIN